MKKRVNKILNKISNLFWIFAASIIWGIVGGLMLFMTIESTRYGFIYVFIFTLFFLPFHLSDYKTFIDEKNWLAFTGRSICLYAIGACVGGFIFVAAGWIEFSIDKIDMYLMAFSILISYFCVSFWLILNNFFHNSRLFKYIFEIVDGMHILGVLWKSE